MPIYEVYAYGSYTVHESNHFTIEAENEEEAKDKAAEELEDYVGETFDEINCDIESVEPTESEIEAEKLAKGYTPRCKNTPDLFDK